MDPPLLLITFLLTLQHSGGMVAAGSDDIGAELEAVKNLKAYVYYPMIGTTSISALVVWTGLTQSEAHGLVSSYTVILARENVEIEEFTLKDNRTSMVLETRGRKNQLTYVLEANMTYTLTVFGSTEEANGPKSYPYNFTTNGATPPEEIILFGRNSASMVLLNGTATHSYNITAPPAAVNTIERRLYWFNSQMNTLHSMLMAGGDEKVIQLLELTNSFSLLSMAYDWIEHSIYLLVQEKEHLKIIWKFSLLSTHITKVFESQSTSICTSAQMIFDPFTGCLLYLLTTEDESELHKVNLTSSSPYEEEIETNFTVAPAITLDSQSGKVWVCNNQTGNFLSCSISPWNCNMEINVSLFLNSSERLVDIGLPATSIAIDEMRLYWSRKDVSNVFYVELRHATTLHSFPVEEDFISIMSISPGKQPLPSAKCLSPDFKTSQNRPVPYKINATNTTIEVGWDMPKLLPECAVTSFLTLSYTVTVEQANIINHGFPMTTSETHFIATNLTPYLEYSVYVSASNKYTEVKFPYQYDSDAEAVKPLYGDEVKIMTTEGIPIAPKNISFAVNGTREVLVYWIGPYIPHGGSVVNELHGNPQNLEFVLTVNHEYYLTTDQPFVYIQNLTPGLIYLVQLQTDNGVFRSKSSDVNISTWPLPPLPLEQECTNFSFTVSVALQAHHYAIESIYLNLTAGTEYFHSKEQSVSTVPFVFNFTIGSLEQPLKPNTQHTVWIIATYKSFQTENSGNMSITTKAGIPDAPEIQLDKNIVKWSIPKDNGAVINTYIILAKALNNTELQYEEMVPAIFQEKKLTFINGSGNYAVYILARNEVGMSGQSNSVFYSYEEASTMVHPKVSISSSSSQTILAPTSSTMMHPKVSNLYTVLLPAIGLPAVGMFILCGALFIGVLYHTKRRRSVFISSHENSKDVKAVTNPQYMWSQMYIETLTSEDFLGITKLSQESIQLGKCIGHGEFGKVYEGKATYGIESPVSVAVKTLRKCATLGEKERFLSEAKIMTNFNHPNIIKVFGVSMEEPMYIVMELVSGGDLLNTLRDAKVDNMAPLLSLTDQLKMATDVAQGCCYLEVQHFVHRDLAARNCLVSKNGNDVVVKIGDFGLAKDLYSSDYYQVEGQRKLPVRWMAPEALLQGMFTTKSDIWSYGVLLWEIMTFGNQPYPILSNQEVFHFVTSGGRLDKPESCHIEIYNLMLNCWEKLSSDRPGFHEVVQSINTIVEGLSTDSVK